MIQATQNQALQRWDTLPQVLREALYSEPNSDFIIKICETEHIPEEKFGDVARITGYVLMGFLHPEDMAEELKGQLNLDPKVCASIASAINQRIFAPLRGEIDKVFEPVSKFGISPKILQEIRPAPQIISQAAGGGGPKPIMSMVPPPAPPKPAPAPAPKPALPDVGWSKSTGESPVVKLSEASPSIPQPAQKIAPVAPRPVPSEIKSSIGEFERIAIQQGGKNVPPPPPPPKPSAAPIPAPVIIHEDAAFRAAPQPSDFHLQLPAEKFGSQGPSMPPPRAAVLELGKTAMPSAAPKPPMPSSAPRAVHYSEYKPPTPVTPSASTPSAPQGARQITEVTATPPKPAPVPMPTPAPAIKPSAPPSPVSAMPKPLTAPQPPSPATPPAAQPLRPSAPPQNKVVYKDYAEPPKPPSE